VLGSKWPDVSDHPPANRATRFAGCSPVLQRVSPESPGLDESGGNLVQTEWGIQAQARAALPRAQGLGAGRSDWSGKCIVKVWFFALDGNGLVFDHSAILCDHNVGL